MIQPFYSRKKWGVEILSSGTCINHFNLHSKIKAGKTNNMVSILEVITSADTVITPLMKATYSPDH